MADLKKRTPALSAPGVILAVSLCACGCFHEYLCAAVSAALTVYLLFRLFRRGRLTFSPHPANIALTALPFLYLLASLWAADRGYAPMGFVKLLPVALFTLALSDAPETRDAALDMLPPLAAAQTAVSAVLMQLPALRSLFSVSGRLAGFFQYPNTFAVFLLMAILVLLTREKLTVKHAVCFAVLVFGVLYSGSRTAAVLTLAFAAAAVFTGRSKKTKLAVGISAAVLAAGAAAFAVLSGNFDTFGRFLRISLTESTLVGRFLYWKDGLRLFAAHPFGMGYMGWNFAQYANQTGVYTVQFIHNDYLQILLDAGVQGFAVFAAAVGSALFSKKTDRRRRLMLLALAAHLFMDFDLEFTGVFMLLAALVFTEGEKKIAISNKAAAAGLGAALCCLSLWFGLSQGLYHFKRCEAAERVYPGNTFAAVAVMHSGSGSPAGKTRAETIVRRNPLVAAAWGELALQAQAAGDYEEMCRCKRLQLECAPYDTALYDEYCRMLALSYGAAAIREDTAAMALCRSEMLGIPALLHAVEEKTDPLAYKIDDRPSFELSETSAAYIEKMKQVTLP